MTDNLAAHVLTVGHATDPVVVHGDHEYSYGDLRAAVGRLVEAIELSPSGRGDRVGIVAQNSFFWAASYLAVLGSGRVAVPFPTVASADDIRGQSTWVDARTFLVDGSQNRRLAPVLHDRSVIGEAEMSGVATRWRPVDVDQRSHRRNHTNPTGDQP